MERDFMGKQMEGERQMEEYKDRWKERYRSRETGGRKQIGRDGEMRGRREMDGERNN